jgi:hypothetical protein
MVAARRPIAVLAAGAALFALGIVIDLAWHATHEEFETAADQALAHAVLWLGVLVLLTAAVMALSAGTRNRGWVVVLAGATLDAGVHVWHFWEHLRHRDPNLPHVLLVLADVVIVAGVIWVALARRRGPAAAA